MVPATTHNKGFLPHCTVICARFKQFNKGLMVQFLCFICSWSVFTGVSEYLSAVVKVDERFSKSDYCHSRTSVPERKTGLSSLNMISHAVHISLGTETSPVKSVSLPALVNCERKVRVSVRKTSNGRKRNESENNQIIEETIYYYDL